MRRVGAKIWSRRRGGRDGDESVDNHAFARSRFQISLVLWHAWMDIFRSSRILCCQQLFSIPEIHEPIFGRLSWPYNEVPVFHDQPRPLAMKSALEATGWILSRTQLRYQQILHGGVKTKQHTRDCLFFFFFFFFFFSPMGRAGAAKSYPLPTYATRMFRELLWDQ